MTEVCRKYGYRIIGGILMLILFTPLSQAGDNHLYGEIKINVTVLTPPCNISDDDQAGISASFPPISYRQFYDSGPEPQAAFSLHLNNCDSNIAKSIRFTFTGTEEPALPGLLALEPASGAKGVAVGIKSDSGTLIKINQPSTPFALADGNMIFNFIAWLQATPEALANRAIEAGDFTSQAVLSLSYE